MIQHALERLIHGRTTIAIAHRLSTLRMADRLGGGGTGTPGGAGHARRADETRRRIQPAGTHAAGCPGGDRDRRRTMSDTVQDANGSRGGATPAAAGHHAEVRMLAPGTLRFAATEGGFLALTVTGGKRPEHYPRINAFPHLSAERRRSIPVPARRAGGKEIGILESLADLSADQAALLRQELERRYFTPGHRAGALPEGGVRLLLLAGRHRCRTAAVHGAERQEQRHRGRRAPPADRRRRRQPLLRRRLPPPRRATC